MLHLTGSHVFVVSKRASLSMLTKSPTLSYSATQGLTIEILAPPLVVKMGTPVEKLVWPDRKKAGHAM